MFAIAAILLASIIWALVPNTTIKYVLIGALAPLIIIGLLVEYELSLNKTIATKDAANNDKVCWYHIVVSLLCPAIGLPWGIRCLLSKQKRSGRVMVIISSFLIVLMIVLAQIKLSANSD